jgi:hypothetical protein
LRVISSIKGSITIRQAVPEDAVGLRELRLEALQNHPEAFGSDYDNEVNHPFSIAVIPHRIYLLVWIYRR